MRRRVQKIIHSGLAYMLLLGVVWLGSCQSPREISADILISNGLTYIGNLESPQKLNVAIKGERIVYVGEPEDAKITAEKTIDATGMIVCPGFIDPHTHTASDLSDTSRQHNLPFLFQGVTTVFNGNDGYGPMPIGRTLNQWERQGVGTNAALLVGHGSVRRLVMGMENRAPTQQELEKMKAIVTESMRDGAFGISTGLYYAPGSFASTEEIIALSEVVAAMGGIYDTHQRDESSYNIGVINSIKETIQVGAAANIPVNISHIKALGVDVWGLAPEIVRLIDSARTAGVSITTNQYPYLASGTSIGAAVLPTWVREGSEELMFQRINDDSLRHSILAEVGNNIRRRGGAESLLMTRAANQEFQGKTLADMSSLWQISEAEAAMRILVEGDSRIASFNMNESDVKLLMQQPWNMTGSDGSTGHPRKYGTFPYKIRKYVLQEKVLRMEEMIHRSTALVAETFQIAERGMLAEGYFADIVIMDPERITDRATFEQPEQFAEGIDYVFVNGAVAIENGQYTHQLAGKVLRKQP